MANSVACFHASRFSNISAIGHPFLLSPLYSLRSFIDPQPSTFHSRFFSSGLYLTPATIRSLSFYFPFSTTFHFLLSTFQLSGCFFGAISQDQICARSFYRDQRLHHDLFSVHPAQLRTRLHQRILTAHIIGSHRHVEGLFHTPDDIQVWEGRFARGND